ncbi:RRM domain-containing protein [Psidium guajava]|nr:RRM domain-containing protein [Psidium guajava]
MAQSGVVRFHGNLDPTAQEFRPVRNPNPPFFAPLPLPPPPPPPAQQQQLYYPPAFEVQVVPFQYHHQQHHAAPLPPAPSVAPPLPPPSPTATRALALGPVPGDASESWVRRELEVFGDVRAVQMERARRDGVVTVHFYDLRHAKRALRVIREQHMQRQCRLRDHYGALPSEEPCCLGGPPASLAAGPPAVWAQFVIPAVHAIPEGQNQGTIVVFNLDPDVSAASLRALFDPFGPVKELRETPFKKHQRFVEFYDVRDAAKALAQMNGKEIHGKNVVIEFSRPGGYNRKFLLDAASPTPFAHDSSYLYNSPTAFYHAKIPKNSPPPPPPLPSPRRVAAADPPGLRILQPSKPDKKQLSGLGVASPNVEKSSEVDASMSRLSLSGGDARGSERVEGEYCNKGSVVTARKSAKKRQGNSIKQQQSLSCRSSGGSSSGRPWKSNKQGRHKVDSRFVISEEDDSAVAESSSGDSRTTVMIKNIPNKYSQMLLLNMLDNHCIHCNEQQVGEDHCEDDDGQPLSAYDFVYLPIDFK